MITLSDYLILNVLFLLCCIPIFTIGAAQAGVYSGIAALNDKEDDTPCVRNFFRGFSDGFDGIQSDRVQILNAAGAYAPVWLCVTILAVFIVYQSVVVMFHSRFGCTPGQLLKNVLYVILAHPLRNIAVAILTWFPAIICASAFDVFVKDLLLILLCYYSIAFLLNFSIMKKLFQTLENNFYKSIDDQETADGDS